MDLLILFIMGPGLAITWLALEMELSQSRGWRMACGITAMIGLTIFAYRGASFMERLNYNAWYNSATSILAGETIKALEAGKTEIVLEEFKNFHENFRAGYEHRGNYLPMAKEMAERMKNWTPSENNDISTKTEK